MFHKVDLPKVEVQPYFQHTEPTLMEELVVLARACHDLRFIHVNSTPVGGGVAEILQSLVPLMRSLDLSTEWYTINPPESFFQTTKLIHNLLQGQKGALPRKQLESYLHYFDDASSNIRQDGLAADVWLVHDPQLLPLGAHIARGPHTVAFWICHIDLSEPNLSVLKALWPMLSSYDRFVFSHTDYIPDSLNGGQSLVIPPAIDPTTVKNTPLLYSEAEALVGRMGIDNQRPLVTQVSRFDPWKDPWGVIDAYRVARKSVPGLQLALLGIILAKDDTQAVAITDSVLEYADNDPDIHVLWDPNTLDEPVDRVVNAFQVASEVVIQKSIREGFGLVVAEAMWKGTPVIGGRAGGITEQIEDGVSGFLVDDAETCARRLGQLLQNPELRREIGSRGRESVRSNYLSPRYLRDYLRAVIDIKKGANGVVTDLGALADDVTHVGTAKINP